MMVEPDPTASSESPRREPPRRGNGVNIHGPAWLGRIEITGQHVLAIFAIVVLALASGVTAWLAYRSALAHGAALEQIQAAATVEHRQLTWAMNELIEGDDQTRCLLALLNERERRDALRSGDVCVFIGVKPRQQRRGPPPIFDAPR